MPELPLSPADLSAVLAPLPGARPLPARAYWDEDVFAFDQAEIFGRSWLCVGREDEIARPGEWLLAPLTPAGILVVRGADLAIRAFHNVCRHRAATLLEGACGRLAHLECPYHGWTYELSGALRSAPHAPPGFDRGAHGLSRVRAGVHLGFVFVALDPGAPELERAVGEAPPWLARPELRSLRRGRRVEYEVGANWKLCVENFQESHHFPRVHPALERLTPCDDAASWGGGGGGGPWLGGVMELAPGAETVSTGAARGGRPLIVPEADRRRVRDAMLFPGLLTSLQPDYLLTYRLTPRAPDRTFVVADTYFHPAAFAPGFDPGDVFAFWDGVNREDRAICERQQRGVRSAGYTPSTYAMVEDGVHAFDRLVARRYLAALGARTA
ncbi:(2Fe-2S) ferredoxin [Sorangium cellulosum]|uniref:(2Fe-2S) ferredoxin n=1 Tax=Sorangium cellulosum TaxID=56 RepID=A0A2L0ETD9_SORCE|nr:aromatic ring-hydroxylating dioxygenase subunit alpha [Sorangium cellulosum]AUX42560.1 (2Fe-2S) ferredoxin [Sorangium cellulosum]